MSNYESKISDYSVEFMAWPCCCSFVNDCWQFEHCFYEDLEYACHTALDLGWY